GLLAGDVDVDGLADLGAFGDLDVEGLLGVLVPDDGRTVGRLQHTAARGLALGEGGDLSTAQAFADPVVHRLLIGAGALSALIAEHTAEVLQGCEPPLLLAAGGLVEGGHVEAGVAVGPRSRT